MYILAHLYFKTYRFNMPPRLYEYVFILTLHG